MAPEVILEGVVGSTAYGLATADSDIDYLGIFRLPVETFLGVLPHEDSIVTKGPDRTIHELRKYASLAAAGNPTLTELLFLESYTQMGAAGTLLVSNRDLFLSRRVAKTYGGYALQQAKRLEREGAFESKLRKRSEKHGRHVARLLLQGRSLLESGKLTVRLSNEDALFCRGAGRMALDEPAAFAQLVETGLADLDAVVADSPLPVDPDMDAVNDLVLTARRA